ncbi:MAG: hypothetical protein LBQ16_03400, partial [Gracilibacteraceae bacterium]|nr:hypothetical protein [Gracilibacteraceae bacterium]
MPGRIDRPTSENALRKNIAVWGALFVMLLILGIIFYSLIGGYAVRNDPFYTDLTAAPCFIKNGFEPAYASLKDPELTDWDLELPGGHGRPLVMSLLPANGSGGDAAFLSVKPRKIEDFTILIPFTIDPRQFESLYGDNPIMPGMYLSGIGENWEIYLNGAALVKQQYVNADGEITSFRSQRGVSIPFDKRFINEGQNFLLIHIIGSRDSAHTGLFYTA